MPAAAAAAASRSLPSTERTVTVAHPGMGLLACSVTACLICGDESHAEEICGRTLRDLFSHDAVLLLRLLLGRVARYCGESGL